jgi:V/A-type H+-transporting ATPase subunit I
MLKPLPMKHVLIQVMTEDLPQVSLTLARQGVFAPDQRAVDAEKFPVIPGTHYRELFNQAASRLEKIARLLSLTDQPDLASVRVIEEPELERLNGWLGDVWQTGSSYEEQFRQVADEGRMISQLETSLDNFANLDVDLALLQGDKTFLNLFIGMVPRENVRQLEEAVGLASHLLYNFMTAGETANVIIVGPRGEHESEIHSVLQAADFRALPIPPELRSEPEKIRRDIAARRARLASDKAEIENRLQAWGESIRDELLNARRSLAMAEPFVRLDTSVRSAGQLAALTGWVPARDIGVLEQALGNSLANPFLLTVRDPERTERALVPTALRKSRLLAPFETLIRQYGIPRYGEIDPTPLFAVTFVLMFGMMFGDIGHGLLIALAGWYFRSKLKRFTQFAVLAGLSATLFGFLYGSLFGYEEILHPLWIAPLTDPIYMLTMALIWGVGFLVTVSLISIHNRLVVGQRLEAVFDNNGVVSLTLYLSVLSGLYHTAQGDDFGWPAAVTALAALLALMGFKWHEVKAPLGERALVVFIETLETLTGYVSNTLSFLRVAAFSLNHVALAIAVFTLAGMMDTAGHWITVVLGNLFILVLEGGIVTIQTLRLEYYEGFSRFYFGDGREFEPLRLNAAASE